MKNNYKELMEAIKEKEILIFDFDGTIADNESYYFNALNEVLQRYNVKLLDDEIQNYIGRKNEDILNSIKKVKKIKFNNQKLREEVNRIYHKKVYEDKVRPYEYVKEVIKKYPEKKFVILSANNEYMIRNKLKAWELEDKFKRIISVSDHGFEKEFVIKNTRQFFNKDKSKVILFEDFNKNIKMAKENGVFTVGIEHKLNKGKLIDADLILN